MAILRQYHPDKNQDMPQDVANQKFREISEAFGFLWVKFMVFFLRNPPVMFMGISPKHLVVLHPWKLTVMEPPKKFVVWVDASLLFRNSWDFFVFQVLGLSFSWGGSVVRRRICFILCPDVLSLIGVVDAALLCCNYRRMPQNWKKNHAKNVGAVEVWLGTPFNFSDNAKLGGLKWLFFIPMWRFFNWLILYCMF